ncbi:sugar nucleotide-binding protein [Pseudohaliea rubra]|uniref:dTDP-4-dehydrorhamnose reductase n=1 Tax=Pseudohaliea rubra DSM 19751 TaxID=1265313 RepID=A0A095VN99_9GAMM|nr:sugar nucleotide-binding protein [Pseudohaliea rubra]KGE02957.1 dTDP-4-dehydrorhamnose reductase [Pseudohaliea rubra DSM 19751]
MLVLIIAADSATGAALRAVLARWGRHEVVPITVAASRWKSERQAKKAVRRAAPACVLDLRFTHLLASGDPVQELDCARAHWLAKACERAGAEYLLLSSACVFSGSLPHPYREQETPDAAEPPGSLLAAVEAQVFAACSRAAVLRTGPVIASAGPGLLDDVLRALLAGETRVLDDRDSFCPVPSADLGRVIAGMLDQMAAGAEPRGVFHYASPDRTTLYGFAEAVIAAASQFVAVADGAIAREPAEAGEGGRNWALDCRDLRDTFAIKQVPWRGVIGDAVRAYLVNHQGD